MRRRDHVGHTALMDVSRLNGPPEAWHLGFMLGRASMPAAGSGARISACGCCWKAMSPKQPGSPPELDRLNTERRVIEQMAERRPRPRRWPRWARDKGAVIVTASEGLASRRGRPGRVAPEEKFSRPAFAIALEPGASAPVGPARSPASISARRCGRR